MQQVRTHHRQPSCMTPRFCLYLKRRKQVQTGVSVFQCGVRSDQFYDRQLALVGPHFVDLSQGASIRPMSPEMEQAVRAAFEPKLKIRGRGA